MTGEEEHDEYFRPPLPPEDRLWRHPAEVAAFQRAEETISVTTVRTPLSHALGLATLGAVGGALIVTGLFLTLGGSAAPTLPSGPVIETISVPEMFPIRQPIPEERFLSEVSKTVAPGITQVAVSNETGSVTTGSGVLYRTDGYLLTSHDLVKQAAAIDVTLHDGTVHSGELLGTDHISGLAVVHIDLPDHQAVRLGIIGPPPAVGDPAVAVAGAGAAELAHTTISARNVNVPVNDTQHLHGLIQLPIATPKGGQGGALVDDTGTVIGVIVDLDTPNTTYAVPIGYARKIASELGNGGRAQHPWLGIRGVDLDEATALEHGLEGGVRAQSVIEGSPAEDAGLTKGAIIIAVDGVQVRSMTELILELRLHPPGQAVEVAVLIDGTKYQKLVELTVRSVEDTT